jgi:hypothetical protein
VGRIPLTLTLSRSGGEGAEKRSCRTDYPAPQAGLVGSPYNSKVRLTGSFNRPLGKPDLIQSLNLSVIGVLDVLRPEGRLKMGR